MSSTAMLETKTARASVMHGKGRHGTPEVAGPGVPSHIVNIQRISKYQEYDRAISYLQILH